MICRNIGEEFSVIGFDGKLVTLKTKEKNLDLCDGCYFLGARKKHVYCMDKDFNQGECDSNSRTDGKSVVFESTKQIRIEESTSTTMKNILMAALLTLAPMSNIEAKSVPKASVTSTSGLDKNELRKIEILAKTIYTEARGETLKGKEAVATIIHNRANHKKWRHLGLTGVCRQHKQFSGWNKGEPRIKINNPIDRKSWEDSIKIATELVKGVFKPLTELKDATHYYNHKIVNPSWGKKLRNPVIIGNHRFGEM